MCTDVSSQLIEVPFHTELRIINTISLLQQWVSVSERGERGRGGGRLGEAEMGGRRQGKVVNCTCRIYQVGVFLR